MDRNKLDKINSLMATEIRGWKLDDDEMYYYYHGKTLTDETSSSWEPSSCLNQVVKCIPDANVSITLFSYDLDNKTVFRVSAIDDKGKEAKLFEQESAALGICLVILGVKGIEIE